MGSSIYFPLSALFFSILTIVIFFIKKPIKTFETKTYKILIISNFCGLILELLCTYAAYIHETMPLFSDFILKTYLVYNLIWTFYLTVYVHFVSKNSKKPIKISKKKKQLESFVLFFLVVIVYLLKCNLVIENNFTVRYTNGPSVNFTYTICCLLIIYMLYSILKNKNNYHNKKFIPIYFLIITIIIGVVIQYCFPGLLIMTYIETLTVAIMYHTIENPDVKMIEQLNAAKDQAEKANRAKTDFLSSMSHEIRTPLNAIIGFSECIKDAKDLEEAKSNATDIISASNTLLETVNGILDISKIEAGKIALVNVNYSSKNLFADCVKLIKPRLNDKALEFKVVIAEDVPEFLNGDLFNIKKAIINILTNAVKYTDKGWIKFTVNCVNKTDSTTLIISVEDTGRGIKKENIERLFNKFDRLDETNNTTIEGTGLGLAITKQIIELMHGKITVQSVYKCGSKFSLIIPQIICKNHQAEIVNFKEAKTEKIADLIGKKVLVVDDNKLNLKVASKLLEPFKLIVTCVESGQDCLDLIRNNETFDLILMDDMMPRKSGVETLQELKKMKGFSIPVVALTANAITGMKEKYLNDGFNEYLPKPIERAELNRVLNEFIK